MNRKNLKYLLALVLLVGICVYLFLRAAAPFPPTLLINLDARTDRLKEISEEFRAWLVPVERVSAVKYSPGWKGCSASHLKCVSIAKERDYPWVIIIEDDCILTPNALKQFQSLLPYLWANRNNWDIFYGGTTFLEKKERISIEPPIYNVSGFTTHFCLIHKASYDKILNGYPTDPADFKTQIDVYYAENFRIWTTTPFFAKQRPGKSDIGSQETEDYNAFFDKAEKQLLLLTDVHKGI